MSGDLKQFVPLQILGAAIPTWLFMFASSIVGVAILVGTVGLAPGSVVDVLFSLQLTVLALFAVSTVVFVLTNLLASGARLSLFSSVAAIVVCALHPFAAVAGYRLYGWITNSSLIDATGVYARVAQFYATTLAQLNVLPEDMLHDPMVLGLVPVDGGLTDAILQIENYLIGASILTSLVANLLFALAKRRPSREQH